MATIDDPPKGWTRRELTLQEFRTVGFEEPRSAAAGTTGAQPTVLVMVKPRATLVIPSPGDTVVDGRKIPSALPVAIRTGLAVIPLERCQPPFFISRPFLHNFSLQLAFCLFPGTLTLRGMSTETHPRTKKEQRQAELRQEVCHATVNGNKDASVSADITIIGLEGDMREITFSSCRIHLSWRETMQRSRRTRRP